METGPGVRCRSQAEASKGVKGSRTGSVGYPAASEKLAGASGSRTFDHDLHALDTAGHRPTSRASFRGLPHKPDRQGSVS